MAAVNDTGRGAFTAMRADRRAARTPDGPRCHRPDDIIAGVGDDGRGNRRVRGGRLPELPCTEGVADKVRRHLIESRAVGVEHRQLAFDAQPLIVDTERLGDLPNQQATVLRNVSDETPLRLPRPSEAVGKLERIEAAYRQERTP